MTRDELESWTLPIVGFEVLEVWFSGRVYVVAYGDGGNSARNVAAPETRIALGGPFRLSSPDAPEETLDAGGAWERLVPLLALRHRKITLAAARRDGHLRIEFAGGFSISAEPDAQYENWEVSGPGRLNLAAPPGGGDPRLTT